MCWVRYCTQIAMACLSTSCIWVMPFSQVLIANSQGYFRDLIGGYWTSSQIVRTRGWWFWCCHRLSGRIYELYLLCFVYGVDLQKFTLHYAANPEWNKQSIFAIENTQQSAWSSHNKDNKILKSTYKLYNAIQMICPWCQTFAVWNSTNQT